MFEVNNLTSLINTAKKKNFLIGYLRGSKMAAELLADLPAKNKVALDFPEQAFRMLSSSRINAYLAGPGVVNRAILRKLKNDVPNNSELREIEELFIASESQLFSYLHMKNDKLVPVFEEALCLMKSDGTLDKLYQTVKGKHL